MPQTEQTPGIRPRPTLPHLLDVTARHAFPAALTAGVLVLLSTPMGIPGQAQMQPAWTLACIYFWSLFRPASMPALVVFAIGLLLDLLAQGPIGISILILLLVHATALRLAARPGAPGLCGRLADVLRLRRVVRRCWNGCWCAC